ncbi:MAG TPA: hypothetical protein VKR06_45875 [Ktedonosporobacter sp.]|nr:hypothetical protein [Ktedonosporobacter sp.]
MSKQHDPRPSFQEVRHKHEITLTMLLEELISEGVTERIAIDIEAVRLFDELSMGRAEVVDAILAALSRLAEVEYNRQNLGHIIFLPVGK